MLQSFHINANSILRSTECRFNSPLASAVEMLLPKLQDGPSQWSDIENAAQILALASANSDINAFRNQVAAHYPGTSVSATDLHTGINVSRRAVLVSCDENITIAFEGSDPTELWKNTWANAKGPNWWDLPYPVYTQGNRVHSFFRDMWHGMRPTLFGALSGVIQNIIPSDSVPRLITVTGFSMGGGVST
jgi:hypothetical protein